uniref:Uncharacterized protein n=1 Tax=Oryza sativa subsp. japonica TaxID=39947 RepID=Q69PK3_ORYSJ|nr:hypothetical protein [Oryza sativa Japonica Group]
MEGVAMTAPCHRCGAWRAAAQRHQSEPSGALGAYGRGEESLWWRRGELKRRVFECRWNEPDMARHLDWEARHLLRRQIRRWKGGSRRRCGSGRREESVAPRCLPSH